MGENISKKDILIIVVALIILSIICIIVSAITTTTNNKNNNPQINPYTNEKYLSEKEVQQKVKDMDIYANLDIVVNNLYDFVKVYKGDLATKDYTNYIRDLNENFAKLYKETKDASNLQKYYNDNKEDIKMTYGIETYIDFQDLVSFIDVYKDSNISYKDVTLVKDSVEVETEYTSTKVSLTFSNNVTKQINIAVTNDSTSNNPNFVVSFN